MIIPDQTVKMLCAFCQKENEVNENQHLAETNCFGCGKNILGLKNIPTKFKPRLIASELRKKYPNGIEFTPEQKKQIDKEELIVLLVNELEKNNIFLNWVSGTFSLKSNKFKVANRISENKKLIKKAG